MNFDNQEKQSSKKRIPRKTWRTNNYHQIQYVEVVLIIGLLIIMIKHFIYRWFWSIWKIW